MAALRRDRQAIWFGSESQRGNTGLMRHLAPWATIAALFALTGLAMAAWGSTLLGSLLAWGAD